MLQNLEIVPSTEPRAELIRWLNAQLPEAAPNGATVPPLHKVEQCGNCVAYCLILPDMLPVRCPALLTRVKVPANHEFEAVSNLKIMSDALQRNGILKPAVLQDNADKMVRGNFQANLQMLQWFRGLHTALEEADIEAGQGRVNLEPDRGSLNSSCLSGPIPEDTRQLRRLSVQRPLEERVTVVNGQGDASAAAAAALLSEARSRSGSLTASERRYTSRELLDRSQPLYTGGGRATPARVANGRSASAAAGAGARGASVPVSRKGATTPVNAQLRRGTPTRARPNTVTKPVPTRSPKSPALSHRPGVVNQGGRPVSPPPRTPVTSGARATKEPTTPRQAKGRSVSAPDTVPRAAPATVSVHQPPSGLDSSRAGASARVPPQPKRLEEVQERLQQTEAERQFYYDKLRMIETLVGPTSSSGSGGAAGDAAMLRLTRSIRDILYATN